MFMEFLTFLERPKKMFFLDKDIFTDMRGKEEKTSKRKGK